MKHYRLKQNKWTETTVKPTKDEKMVLLWDLESKDHPVCVGIGVY